MTRDDLKSAALVLLLLLVGALSWRLQLRESLAVDTSSLVALPYRIGDWEGRDVPVEDKVSEMLDATLNVQRAYSGPAASLVWLYVGYYGTERGGRPEHTPWVCYPTAGWEILRAEEVRVRGTPDHRVNELLVEQNGQRRLVHFYYRSLSRTGLLGGFDQVLDQLANRLLTGRADGALVRLSTLVEGDEFVARARLEDLGRHVDGLLGRHWPREETRASPAAAISGAKSSAST